MLLYCARTLNGKSEVALIRPIDPTFVVDDYDDYPCRSSGTGENCKPFQRTTDHNYIFPCEGTMNAMHGSNAAEKEWPTYNSAQ